MYAKGMSTRDIEDHMRYIWPVCNPLANGPTPTLPSESTERIQYGINMSAGMVSKVTDKIVPSVAEWQARLLERISPIVFRDTISL